MVKDKISPLLSDKNGINDTWSSLLKNKGTKKIRVLLPIGGRTIKDPSLQNRTGERLCGLSFVQKGRDTI